MELFWQLVVVGLVSYLIGSVNLSIILSKVLGKGDIRTQGSGNAGTTNTLRVLGKGPAILVLIFDVLKAVAAVFIAKLIISVGNPIENGLLPYDWAAAVAGLAVILGHNFPIYYGFKGGKGIASSLGVLLAIEWKIGLVCLVFALVIMILSRMVSLGSITAAILYPVLVIFMGTAISNKWIYIGFAVLVALLAVIRHRSNIKRLLNGTENKLWKTKKEKKQELS